MKRRFLTFISLTVATLLPLLAPSCSGLATPSAPDAPESSDSQRYTLSGSFTMPNSDAAPAEVTNATPSARNAVPDMSSLIYTVEAVRSDGHTETTTSEDHSTYTFTDLTAGSWQITAYAKTSSGTCVMQSETKSVTLSKSKPDASTSLAMEPASGSGDINLTISWDSNSGIGYCKWSSSDYSALTGSPANPNGSVTIDLRGLSARTYSLNLSFYSSKENEEAGLPPVYKCMEYIAVYPGLTTNKWTARTASHIDASGNFKVTFSCVETFVYRQIYVSSSGNDTSGNGTIEKPFATIEKAMTRLTEVATKGIRSGEISAANPWELHVSGTITATELSNEEAVIYVDANIAHLAIIGEGSGATIDADDLGTILYIGGDANVSMENVTLKNGNSSKGGGVYIDAGKFTMESGTITSNTATDSGGGVYVATGSEFVMNGGTISSNTATYKGGGIYSNQGSLTISNGTITSNIISSPRASGDDGGIGIYIKGGSMTMTGGEISANNKTDNAQTASYIRGGGIRLAGGTQFQMSGGKITRNEIRGLGANIFTQSAQIELSGTAEISYGKIDNSDVSFNADAHGAAIWLEGSGTSLTMSGGEIFGNIAKTKDTKNASAGIYVNFATFTMTGGRIYNNEVQGGNNKGGAFRLGGDTNNGAIKISGSASIPGGVNGTTGPGKNDIFLESGKQITITGDLTATAPVATITPSSYPSGTTEVQVLTGSTALINSNHNKFKLSNRDYSIKDNGYIEEGFTVFDNTDLATAITKIAGLSSGDTLKVSLAGDVSTDTTASGTNYFIKIPAGANVTITSENNAKLQCTKANIERLFEVASGAELTLTNIVLPGPTRAGGGWVYGKLIINNGTEIINTSAPAAGNCIRVLNGGEVEMNGGKIKNNNWNAGHGLIAITSGGKFSLNGGEITNNKYYWSSSNNDNYSPFAGVYIFSGGTFIMTGGTISGTTFSDGVPSGTGSTTGEYNICFDVSGDDGVSITKTGGTITRLDPSLN